MTHHLPEGAGFEFSRKINTQPVGMEAADGGIAEDEIMPPIDPEMERIAQLCLPELFDTLLEPLREYLDSLEPHEKRRVVEGLYHTFSDSYRLGVYEASQEIQGQLEDAIPPLASTAVVTAIGRFLAQEGETGGLNERKPEVLDAGVARSWIEWFKYALYNGDFNAVDWNVENNPVDVILSIALEVYGKGPSQDEMAQVRRMLQQMAKDYLIGDKEGGNGMSEALQETLIDYRCSFPDFKTELSFWIDAAHRVCEEMLNKGINDFSPNIIAECIEGRYPVARPINVDDRNALMEELAEVCAFYDGAHGYRGVFIPERLNYGGQNE